MRDSQKRSTRNDKPQSSKFWDWSFRILQLLIAIPAAVVAISLLTGSKLPLRFMEGGSPALKVVCSILLLAPLITLSIWRLPDSLARFRLKPIGQTISDTQAAQYRELITLHCRMLSITTKDLAVLAGLHWWEARFLLRHPDFIPRLDVQEQIRKALMVGDVWPRGGYSDESTICRLMWYTTKGDCAYTAIQIFALTPENRAVVLDKVEKKLRKGLGYSDE